MKAKRCDHLKNWFKMQTDTIRIFVRITDGLTNISGWLAALCLLGAALIVTEAVIVHKLLGISTILQTEASVFLLIFTVFVGAALYTRSIAPGNSGRSCLRR